jgi:hypothetical protein
MLANVNAMQAEKEPDNVCDELENKTRELNLELGILKDKCKYC